MLLLLASLHETSPACVATSLQTWRYESAGSIRDVTCKVMSGVFKLFLFYQFDICQEVTPGKAPGISGVCGNG